MTSRLFQAKNREKARSGFSSRMRTVEALNRWGLLTIENMLSLEIENLESGIVRGGANLIRLGGLKRPKIKRY